MHALARVVVAGVPGAPAVAGTALRAASAVAGGRLPVCPTTPSHCRALSTRPWPTVTTAQVSAVANAIRRPPTLDQPVHRSTLNEAERRSVNGAKAVGYLRLDHRCTAAAINVYFAYCCHAKRPYIAIHRDGAEVAVDLTPLAGVGKRARREGDVDTMVAASRAVLAAHPSHVQVVNVDTLEEQAKGLVPGSTDGGIAHKKADSLTAAGDAFTAYTTGRPASSTLAAALYDSYIRTFRLPTAADRAALVAARLEKRRAARLRLRLRRLRALAANPIAVKNLRVKAGALDGFIAADAAGRVPRPGAPVARTAAVSAPPA